MRSQRDMGVDMSAPIPLGHFKAIQRATELRNQHGRLMSYSAISIIMSEYHGVTRSPSWWSDQLHAQGVRLDPRGHAYIRNGLRAYLAGHIDGPGGVNI